MADYCTIADVKGWLPNGQTIDEQTTTPPDKTTVSGWITKFSNAIDAAFAQAGTAIPTDTKIKDMINLTLARELVYQIMAVRGAAKDEEKEALYLGWHKDWETLLKKIDEGAFGSTSPGLAWSFTQDSVAGETSDDPSIDPKFDIDARY